MVDFIVGIAVLFFILLGLWEGFVKSLGSVAAVFAALFAAVSATDFISRGYPQFSNPNDLGAAGLFLMLWLVSFVLLDILLAVLFKKMIKITVLGPLDKVGGVLVGGFRGVLVCGILLQLAFYLPFSTVAKDNIRASSLSRFSVEVYNFTLPLVERFVPAMGKVVKHSPVRKEENKKEESAAEEAKKTTNKVKSYQQATQEREARLMQLLEDQNLLPDAPKKVIKDVLKK